MISKYSILIICEGENTEPFFFRSIRDEIIKGTYNLGNVSINIRPEPKDDQDEDQEPTTSPHKIPRKKIQIRKISEDGEPDKEPIPLPLKWVLEGQEELREGTFNEVWTVFDDDNFPAKKEAFEAADVKINGENVIIAYSSICFEYYLLLHFEQIFKSFQTSECRYKEAAKGKAKAKSKPINCSSGTHEKDCNGDRCIGGYARKKGYWTGTKSKTSTFELIKDKLEIGFENSAWLRFVSNKHFPKFSEYEINPFVTVDSIVKRLIGKDDINWIWINLNQDYLFDNISIMIDDNLNIHFQNVGRGAVIIPKNAIKRVDKKIQERQVVGDRVFLNPNDIKIIELDKTNLNNDDWFIFELGNNRIMFDNNYFSSLSISNSIERARNLNRLSIKELMNLIDLIKDDLK